MKKKEAFLILGNNDSGKTTLQKKIIRILTGWEYDKLTSDLIIKKDQHKINCKWNSIFFIGRSFQEREESKDIDSFFINVIDKNNLECLFLSSHINEIDINLIIRQLSIRYYNLSVILFSNKLASYKLLDETFYKIQPNFILIDNPEVSDTSWNKQIESEAISFSYKNLYI